MCCELYFREALHSSSSGRVFINATDLSHCILSEDDETKTDKEGDSYGR
jgi:hypothetical protein